jgi:hypothetical protein
MLQKRPFTKGARFLYIRDLVMRIVLVSFRSVQLIMRELDRSIAKTLLSSFVGNDERLICVVPRIDDMAKPAFNYDIFMQGGKSGEAIVSD